jgi:NAD(P)-dependent dehydrogenase (short-subunit alcohol dehydrogenase family)
MQVNALGTFLLGVLLLPLLAAGADAGARTYKPHLTFVSSGTVWSIKPEQMQDFMASKTPLEDLNAEKFFPPGAFGGTTQYARSKLVLEYAVRHLVTLPSLKGVDGNPKVIINTACPGMCKSELGRQMTQNPLIKFLSWLMFAIVARTAEQGANTFISALTLGDDSQGELWKDDRVYETPPMITTEEGQKLGDKVWGEVLQVIVKADPRTKTYLS